MNVVWIRLMWTTHSLSTAPSAHPHPFEEYFFLTAVDGTEQQTPTQQTLSLVQEETKQRVQRESMSTSHRSSIKSKLRPDSATK